MRNGINVVLATLVLSGCASRSIGTSESGDQLVLTDASNRAISAVRVDVDSDGRRVKPRRVLCAEPSPDIAKAVSSAIEASLGARAEKQGVASASVDASYGRSATESIAQLGSRLATIQLLRDELADLCRAYANGAVSSITYTLRLSRLDKKMITLLVSEASAGALSKALVGIDSVAHGDSLATPERLLAAEGRVKAAARAVSDAGKTVSDAQDRLNKASDDAARTAAAADLANAEAGLKSKLADLSDRVSEKLILEVRGGGTVRGSAVTLAPGGQIGTVSAVDLRAIHRAYLEDDDAGTLLDACLTSMEDNASPIRAQDPEVAKLRGETEKKEKELAQIESELDSAKQRLRTQGIPAADEQAKFDALLAKARLVRLDLNQLERRANEQSGVSDRTALLKFCRTGMDQIAGMIERKIIINAEAVKLSKQTELCKAALADSSISAASKSACIDSVVGAGRPSGASRLTTAP